MLVSAIQQGESPVSIHMSLASWTSPHVPPNYTPVSCHRVPLWTCVKLFFNKILLWNNFRLMEELKIFVKTDKQLWSIISNLTSHIIFISPGCPLMSLAFQDPVHNLLSLHSLSCVPSVLCSVDYSFSPGLSWLWQSWGRLARDCRRPPGWVCLLLFS